MSIQLVRSKASWYFPVFFVIIGAIGIISAYYVYQVVGSSLKQSLIYRAETISLALDIQEIKALEGNETDLNRVEYQHLKEQLRNIREANKDSKFVYLMGRKNNQLYVVADSELPDSDDYSPPGQVYFEESIALTEAFTKRSSGVEGPTQDRWGNWITSVAPIVDRSGKVVAAVGIDVDAASFQKELRTYTALPLIAMTVLIIFVYFGMKMRRQEQEFLDIKSKFVAVASHDIRSPLTGLSWAMQSFVQNPRLNTEDKTLATDISDQIQHLLATSNDILDAMSLDTGKVRILQDELRISDIIKHSVENMNFYARQEDITLSVDVIPENAYVRGDQGKLQQLFINLISNAIKYSHKGGEVALRYSFDDNFHAIEVVDHGIGIPEAEQKYIFNGFYRANNAQALSVHGTGLGLYLVQRIALLHSGEVSIDSVEQKGTTVTVKLPRVHKAL
ncbi:MAG: hypothetical protein RLY57_552 [Candidatus Parcubacteria bacterium]|jgi:signal transduction histidine kinase